MRLSLLLASLAIAALPSLTYAAATTSAITAPGPQGPLEGTYIDTGRSRPVVLMVPGSGPTDRDGDTPGPIRPGTLRLLAEGLAEHGISSTRIDKRGMFGSRQAVTDANAVTIADYAHDIHTWIGTIREQTGQPCVWLLGHSEGGIVALATAREPDGICGLILLATPATSLIGAIDRQLHANPANAPLMPQIDNALSQIKAGHPFDDTALSPALRPVFARPVQNYLIDSARYVPASMTRSVALPVLIVQGGSDLQVSLQDATELHNADPRSRLVILPSMSHVLKDVSRTDRASMQRAYTDPTLPLSAELVPDIAEFVAGH